MLNTVPLGGGINRMTLVPWISTSLLGSPVMTHCERSVAPSRAVAVNSGDGPGKSPETWLTCTVATFGRTSVPPAPVSATSPPAPDCLPGPLSGFRTQRDWGRRSLASGRSGLQDSLGRPFGSRAQA